jgi:hypothetical protein
LIGCILRYAWYVLSIVATHSVKLAKAIKYRLMTDLGLREDEIAFYHGSSDQEEKQAAFRDAGHILQPPAVAACFRLSLRCSLLHLLIKDTLCLYDRT